MIPLLSAFYFGSVEHYRLLARHRQVIIDTGEHYERQSYRTRTGIVGPNGRQDLVVQVAHEHGRKTRSRELRLSYAETWPQQHVHAIRSAYGQTPWAIHYIDSIEAVVLQPYERLIDLQLATMDLALKWLGITTQVFISGDYVEGQEYRVTDEACGPIEPHTPAEQRRPLLDLRNALHPKRPLPPEVTPVAPYPQVFADRHGFVPRMSIIDLLCNCGPQAMHQLGR